MLLGPEIETNTYTQISNLHSTLGIQLKKWISNNTQLLLTHFLHSGPVFTKKILDPDQLIPLFIFYHRMLNIESESAILHKITCYINDFTIGNFEKEMVINFDVINFFSYQKILT